MFVGGRVLVSAGLASNVVPRLYSLKGKYLTAGSMTVDDCNNYLKIPSRIALRLRRLMLNCLLTRRITLSLMPNSFAIWA